VFVKGSQEGRCRLCQYRNRYVVLRQQSVAIRPNGDWAAPLPQGCRLSRLHRSLSDPLDIPAEKTALWGSCKGSDMADEASRKGEVAPAVVKSDAVAVVPAKPKLAVATPNPVPAQNEEANKVVHIVRRLQEETIQRRALKQRPWVPLSIAVCVLLPTLVTALFYLFVASDRFVSEARFAVRSNESQAFDALGMITGLPSSQIVSDSYIVADYIGSRDMVDELMRRLPLRSIYTDGDYFSRVGDDVTQEELIKYWQKRIDVYYDSTKNTISVEVQAFNPTDADRITREVVDIVRTLVNDLSAQARRDAVQFAASEVARSELRVRGARDDLLAFRLANNELDPTQTAEATLGIAAQLEAERSKLASELASLSGYLSDDAPSIQMLKSRITALAGEVARIQGQISVGADPRGTLDSAQAGSEPNGPGPQALASVIGDYQELTLNQEFAEKAYTAAMASLERARAEASRTQTYLAIYGQPSVAEEATYPRRWLNIWVVFALSSILWAIGVLGFMTVRDHVS
jgi:capsular polysaccharide transport system permease protein